MANYLKAHAKVTSVIFPGLQEGEARRRADAYLKGGYGGLVGFELTGGAETGRRFIDAQAVLPRRQHRGCAVARHPPGHVRLSIGIEHPDDIIADLEQALAEA